MPKTNKNIFTPLGANNHTEEEREIHDYYATDPYSIDILLDETGLTFNTNIWEPCCGEGHMSKRLKERGFKVFSSDLINRNYGEVIDFLKTDKQWGGDIITNPPYSDAVEVATKALESVRDGAKVCMFLKVLFLESKNRKKFFAEYPPKYVFVSSSRIKCAKNGDFEKYTSSAVAYAWYVWEKGYKGDTIVKWIN